MTRYIFDTDHITLYRANHAVVRQRVAAITDLDLSVTIISFHEQIEGWFAEIHRAQKPQKLIWAYDKLHQTFAYFAKMQMLLFDESAAKHFLQLHQQRIRIGTQDLRIASIALANGCIVVTRNRRDFERVPGLTVEDWSAAVE